MRARQILACGLAVVLASECAQAATVGVVGGPVSVNTGNGFKPIRASANVAAGDLVMAGAGGSAEITYDDGCKQTVNAGETVSVAATSPCKAGALGNPMEVLVLGGLATAVVIGGIAAVSDDGASP